MKGFKYLLLSSFVALAACSDKSSSNNTANAVNVDSTSIVGGTEVKAGDIEMRSTVGIYDMQEKALCTGTLIAQNLVLTAGHCVGEDPTKMVILFKEKFDGAQKENIRAVTGAVRHPEYDPKRGTDTADIAVIKFDPGAAGLPAGYATAKVLTDFSTLQKGTDVVVAGYGLSWSWVVKKGAGTLRTTELQVENPHFSNTEISLKQSVKHGVCSGDSGGPGYIKVNGDLYLWGVVSRGDSLPIPLTPNCFIFSVFTRVDVYTPFIKEASATLNGLTQ